MSDFALLASAGLSFGEPLTALEFSAPLWSEIERTSDRPYSTAIVDNTTVRNSLSLLAGDGLGPETSGRGIFIPDLAVLVFALANFERVLVLANGLDDRERERARELLGDALVFFDFRNRLRGDDSANALPRTQFSDLQERFKQRVDLLEPWRRAWAELLAMPIEGISPYYFTEGEPSDIIDSPRHPLRFEAVALERPLGLPPARRELPDSIEGERHHFGSRNLEVRAGASYQTFRGIFYAALGEAIGFPYVACSMRTALRNFIPFEPGTDMATRANVVISKLVSAPTWIKTSSFGCEYPILAIHPTLAPFMDAAWHNGCDWRAAVAAVRDESRHWREALALLNERFRTGSAGPTDLERLREELRSGKPAGRAPTSVVKIGAAAGAAITEKVAHAHLVGANLESAGAIGLAKCLELILESVLERGLDAVFLGKRRRMEFVLAAQDLVAQTSDIDEMLEPLFGRGLTETERAYLQRLARIGPQTASSAGSPGD